jgi:hypothetical protein
LHKPDDCRQDKVKLLFDADGPEMLEEQTHMFAENDIVNKARTGVMVEVIARHKKIAEVKGRGYDITIPLKMK